MAKLLSLLLLLLVTTVSFAQKKKKQPVRKFVPPVIKTGKPAGQASPGSTMTFPDLLLLLDPQSVPDDLLAKKKFLRQNNIPEDATRMDTFYFRNNQGESLTFYRSPYYRDFAPGFLFQTTSAGRARQLMQEAFKNGFTATDSTVSVANDGEENYLIHHVAYSEAIQPEMPGAYESPPPPGQYNIYRNSVTTYEMRTQKGPLYSFYVSGKDHYNMNQGIKTMAGDPDNSYPDVTDGPSAVLPADTVRIQPGEPALIFVHIGYPVRNKTGSGKDPDSLHFFAQLNNYYSSSNLQKGLYPPDKYRYINIHKPCILLISNGNKETFAYSQPGKFYSGVIYWSGKSTDKAVQNDSWQDVAYVVANARGDNKLMPGYKYYRDDSLTVQRLLQHPQYKPSLALLQQVNYFILSVLYKDIYLPLPLMQLTATKSMLMTGATRSIQYHFNRGGLLDSVRSQPAASFSWNTITVAYKDGVPAAVYSQYDTTRLSYAADTLIVLQRNHLYRYKLIGKLLLQIDDFDLGSDDYFRNDIRDDYYNAELTAGSACLSKFRDREMSILRYSECYSNTTWQLPLSMYTPKERRLRDKDGNSLPKRTFEQDAAGNLLIVDDAGAYLEKKSAYIFRHNMLQEVRITSKDRSVNDGYYVYTTRYE